MGLWDAVFEAWAEQVKGLGKGVKEMAKLKKLRVAFISLVRKPANKLDIVYKSSDAKFTDDKEIKITKSTAEGLVYGTVYAPNVKDSDGDWADAATIRAAAHEFLRKGATRSVDREHDEQPCGAAVVESHVNGEGAWDVAIQMDPQSETFQKVQKGEIKGLSMGAFCEKSDEEPPAEGKSEEGAVAKKLDEMSAKIEKMAGEIANLNQKVDRVPKSRQMVIDGDKVSIEKGADEALREFNFKELA
ncbi:MAG TPA: XkdF-like putative serine protease domain-containing protein [Candidatus Cloacimonadota bacterium]|nr:XkdF-like putative serine protease domain-containing protein [Candidatus Cloacimonadota bacterium]